MSNANEANTDLDRANNYAKVAITQLKALKQPPVPKNYEIWYTYATGYMPRLNQAINETIENKGNISLDELENIYENFLSPSNVTERVDEVSAKFVTELDEIIKMVHDNTSSTSEYQQTLKDTSVELKGNLSKEVVQKLVQKLSSSTKEIMQKNELLESNLNKSQKEIKELKSNLEAIRVESLTDPLTSLANRKYFDQQLQKVFVDAHNTGEPFSVLMTDIDHFKKFNDTHGHLTGDQVLRLVAMSVQQNVKGQDTASRYGGEEFAIILPETNNKAAVTVADQIRRAVMMKELMKRSTKEHLGRITISIGVATWRPEDDPHAIIERADECLYAAKNAGRNRVMAEADLEALEAQKESEQAAS